MKIKVLAFAVVALLVANMSGFAGADTRRGKTKKKRVAPIVALLPASDGVAVFDAKRFLDSALPQLLSANQPMLAHITSSIDLIKERTAIDVHKFDSVAVGVKYKQISATETDYEPLVLATATDFNFGALIAAAKIASNGEYRTETVGGKSVFIFKVKPETLVKKPATAAANSKVTDAFDKVMQGFTKEIAVAAIDANTLAIGTVSRVRETLTGQSHLSAELSGLVAQQDGGIMSFALRPPGGLAKLLPLESDELGKTIASIQLISGSLDITANGSDLHIAARTKTSEDALNLRDTLEVGQSFGKMAFAGKKRPDQQVYARMIDAAKLSISGTSVTVDVQVPQADLDVLIAGIK
jgi:hypothetical protein